MSEKATIFSIGCLWLMFCGILDFISDGNSGNFIAISTILLIAFFMFVFSD